MFHTKSIWASLCLLGLLSFTPFARAQLTVDGVVDKTVYPDAVSVRVPPQAGFTYTVLLNTHPFPTSVFVPVNRPDYYELKVTRTETATGIVTNRLVRFIVESSERVGTELGLPPQVPFPVIQSSSNEFVGGNLRVLTPQNFPTGYDIPVITWVENDQGHAIRANGLIADANHPPIQVKRGVGSGFLAATNPVGVLNYTPRIGGLTTNKSITLENSTSWTTVSGTLSGNVSWPINSRIHVTTNLILTAGSTLTVGAGTIVRVNSSVTITNNGSVVIEGTVDQPVVFMATARAQPWGGFVQHANNASFTATGAIFTGSGAEPCWYLGHGCSTSLSGIGSHRGEQALISLVGSNCNVTMTDSAAIWLTGQLGHSVGGGNNRYNIQFTRFLMQHCTTGGEYTGARFTVNDSAFIECPDDSVNFVDGDNDALYIVDGTHSFTNSLFGWTKDDGVDSGGSGYGPLTYQSCWFEATFHEGNSLSGYKNTFARDSVYFDCGQGIEDGYDSPTGRVDHCLFTVCQSGVRHGDNYQTFSGYSGTMTTTNCILLYNHRDVFGYNWDNQGGWTNSYELCFASNNLITVADPNFPNNTIWNPATDAWRLGSFGGVGRVGAALAVRAGQGSLANFPDGLPVALSRFCTNLVTITYSLDTTDGLHTNGTLIFTPGMTRTYIPLPASFNGVLRVALTNAVNADLTGASTLLVQNLAPPTSSTPTVLSPLGATWKYLDNGTDQGTGWRTNGFNDSTWASGAALLGFGTTPSPATTIRRYVTGTSGWQFTNYYFRRSITVTNPANFATLQFRYQRDDGCIVYLNGNAIITNNMPSGPANFMTFAATTITPAAETQRFWTNTLPAALLQPGNNTIAAEVHQSTTNSSDIAWEMELQGLPASPASRVDISYLGGDAVLYWNDASLGLQEADFVNGPWRNAAKTNSPSATPATGTRFFKLKK